MPNISEASVEAFTFSCERGHMHIEAELNGKPIGEILEDLEQDIRNATNSPAEYITLTSALLTFQVRGITSTTFRLALLKTMVSTCTSLATELASSKGDTSLPCFTYHGDPVAAAGLTPEPAPAELRAMVQRREKAEATEPGEAGPDDFISMLKEVFGEDGVTIIDLNNPEEPQ